MKKNQAQTSKACLAVVADCHIANYTHHAGAEVGGINERGLMSLAALRESIRRAVASGATMFMVAGDLFNKRKPEPAIIAAVARVLEAETKDLPVVIVPGNHDMVDVLATAGNTACEPLYAQATVIREPEWFDVKGTDLNVLCVPFQGEVPMEQYLRELLPKHAKKSQRNVLIAHVGVYDGADPDWMKSDPTAIHQQLFSEMLQDNFFEAAFVGHYHHGKSWGKPNDMIKEPIIVQVGTLCPSSHSDAGVFPEVGTLLTYADPPGEFDRIEINGPRFTSLNSAEEIKSLASAEGMRYFVRLPASEVLVSAESIQGIEVEAVADVEEKPTAITDQVESPEEAIIAYARKMNLPEGVLTEAVIEEALRCWRTT